FDVSDHLHADTFRFRLGPQVYISLETRRKQPGELMVGEDVELIACREDSGQMAPYERLLYDAMHGETTLFARQDEVEAAWRVVDPILDDATPVHPYEPGTWGPTEADALLRSVGSWRGL